VGVRRVFYQPARPTPDGRTLLALSPLEFLETLSRLIPPPRVHRHRYHGVLAPNARLRARVVALGRDEPGTSEPEDDSPGTPGDEPVAHFQEDSAATLTGDAARSRWARLLARIYEVFPLRCPDCGSDMRILAFLTDPEPTGAILRHLHLPDTAPRIAPARAPPQAALELDTDHVATVDDGKASLDPRIPSAPRSRRESIRSELHACRAKQAPGTRSEGRRFERARRTRARPLFREPGSSSGAGGSRTRVRE
jgi:hypothetical protein